MTNKMQRLAYFSVCIIFCLISTAIFISNHTSAQEEGFSLQVTPSPLIATVKPGETTELELKIRNTNTKPETLVMGIRSFEVNQINGEIELSESTVGELENFVSFKSPVFTLDAGQWFDQKIIVSLPEDTGFSYSFAVTISRDKQVVPEEGSSAIEGSVAVFTLLTVDKPGAVRSFEVTEFKTEKNLYEYLPAKFTLKIKNTGNVIVQPKGNLFTQRSSNDSNPISTIPINNEGGYILPDTERTFEIKWDDGFPLFKTNPNTGQTNLEWNFANSSSFRIGKYTAQFVAIYDDGERDVPIVGEVSFWVIPWKQLILFFAALLLMIVGAFYIVRGIMRSLKSKTKNIHDSNKD
jgi:hypothetical protein